MWLSTWYVFSWYWYRKLLWHALYDFMIFLNWPCDFNLWSCVLVILWLCYKIFTRPRHFMFIIFMSRHACTDILCMIYYFVYSRYNSRYYQIYRYFILWSHVLIILWLYYTTVTRPGHFIFIINMSHHACTVSLYIIYRLDFPIIIITVVLDTAKYIIVLTSMPYLYCYCIFIFSLLPFYSFVYSC